MAKNRTRNTESAEMPDGGPVREVDQGEATQAEIGVNDQGQTVLGVPGGAAAVDTGNPIMVKETKAQRFERLAVRRINKALHALDQILPLSNKSQYDYTEGQTKAMLGAFRAAIDAMERAFGGKPVVQAGFSFRGSNGDARQGNGA